MGILGRREIMDYQFLEAPQNEEKTNTEVEIMVVEKDKTREEQGGQLQNEDTIKY